MHPNPGPPRYPCSVCFKNVISQGTSYLCTKCSHGVHSRCSGLRNVADYRRANGWICTTCRRNANGIGNKQTELSIFLEAHNVEVAAIQKSKLRVHSRSPNNQNYTIIRQDRHLGPGGGLLFFKSITQSASLASHCQQRRRTTPT